MPLCVGVYNVREYACAAPRLIRECQLAVACKYGIVRILFCDGCRVSVYGATHGVCYEL